MTSSMIVGVDGSERSLAAVRLAARLGADASLRIVHAIPSAGRSVLGALDQASLLVGGAPGVLTEEWHRRRELEATRLLADAVKVASEARTGIELHTDHAEGRPADVLLEQLRAHAPSMLVLGSHGRGALTRVMTGSVCSEVVERADGPVLVVRTEEIAPVLLCVDGSDGSLRAARIAGELASRTGAPVRLITAFEFPIDTFGTHRAEVAQAFQRQANDLFAAVRALPGLEQAEGTMIFHEPSHAIIVEAENRGAGLVVVGRRGRAEGRRTGLGSVSRKVALGSGSSVLVVP